MKRRYTSVSHAVLFLLFLLLLLVFSSVLLSGIAVADTEIYRWVDKDGNVHYTDCPPPPSCNAETIAIAPGPSTDEVMQAQERLDTLLADQQQKAAAHEQEKLERERLRIEAMELAVERKRACVHARQNLHKLQQQLAVYYIDEDGEYVYLDDEARELEIDRTKGLISKNCKEP